MLSKDVPRLLPGDGNGLYLFSACRINVAIAFPQASIVILEATRTHFMQKGCSRPTSHLFDKSGLAEVFQFIHVVKAHHYEQVANRRCCVLLGRQAAAVGS